MENRPIGPEEKDDTTDSTSSKKKRGSTLSRYLSALRGKEAPASDSEDASAEKPKRAQRLLSRLFPGIVERPAHLPPKETGGQEHEFNHEAWFGWARQAKQGESTQPQAEQEEPVSLPEAGRTTEIAEPYAGEQSELADQPVVNEAVPEVNQDLGANPNVAVPTIDQINTSVSQPERDRNEAMELPVLQSQEVEIPLRQSTETETIIERRGSNLLPIALVGAEYLGRKRAGKKLESRVDKKMDTASEKQRRSETLQKELEQVVSQNKQQIEQLKRARVDMERQTLRSPERKEVPPAVVPHAEIRPAPRSEAARVERSPLTEEAVRPQIIAERVAYAAEHDVPVERAFERSHEVKDDIPMATGAAASVGSVVAANVAAAGLAPIVQATGSSTTQGNKDLPFISDADIAASYKQVAKMGFWTAICLIVLGSIAYLMVRYI